jgi:hypothetical protein
MRRPDQDLFDQFSRHFETIDADLTSFCLSNNLELQKNFLRQPCRVLRRKGNPEYLVDLAVDGYWREMEFSEDLPHSLLVMAYFEATDSDFVWRKSTDLAKGQKFSELRNHLLPLLERSVTYFEQWTPDVITREGEKLDNLKRKYGVT